MSRDLAAAPPFDLPETGRGAALNPTHWVRANSNSCNVKKSQWVLWGGEEGAGGGPRGVTRSALGTSISAVFSGKVAGGRREALTAQLVFVFF